MFGLEGFLGFSGGKGFTGFKGLGSLEFETLSDGFAVVGSFEDVDSVCFHTGLVLTWFSNSGIYVASLLSPAQSAPRLRMRKVVKSTGTRRDVADNQRTTMLRTTMKKRHLQMDLD